jgi:glycosyltransferase involved in cell wall biosynthesis
VDTARYVPVAESGAAEVLYVGSFRHLPNVIGFDKLRREIMPRVWERFPEARLRVVAGPDYETFWHRYAHNGNARIADRRITIHGFIEDLRPLYASAAVVVAPLEVSAGTNIKVLEAMACGRALVSTPVGSGGLGLRHGKDAMICGDAISFANAVCDLLDSPGLRGRMGAQARRTVENRFDWRGIAQRACASYLALMNRHHSMSRSEIPWRGSVNPMERIPPAAATQWGESSISS